MRRLAAALPAVVVLAALYLLATRGGAHHSQPSASPAPTRPAATGSWRPITPVPTTPTRATPAPRTPIRRAVPAPTPSASRTRATPRSRPQPRRRGVITAPRTDCRWHRYRDGALGTDRSCAPGALDPAVVAHPAQTICNRRWLASASRPQVKPATRTRLVIEYQLPGPVANYVVAHVVPIEDGGSPTNPRNLYVLPLNGWGGERTQAVIAARLHDEICAHRLTVARAARTLRGDWLAAGVPVD